jgi:hypothetical protein
VSEWIHLTSIRTLYLSILDHVRFHGTTPQHSLSTTLHHINTTANLNTPTPHFTTSLHHTTSHYASRHASLLCERLMLKLPHKRFDVDAFRFSRRLLSEQDDFTRVSTDHPLKDGYTRSGKYVYVRECM